MKYYLIAGERSGDLHGSNLIKELKSHDPEAVIRCWGGDLMEQSGGKLVVHYRNLSFMGIWEVFKNLLTIKKYLDFCKKDLLEFQPDVLVLIDYPGFNLRIAEFAAKQQFKTCYFISPKLWAWNQKRAKKIKRYVDKMFVILPFEKQFYQKYQYQVTYVGNPLVQTVAAFESEHQELDHLRSDSRPIVAILPGSRAQEISHMLEVMLALVPEFSQYKFVLAAVDNVPDEYYQLAKGTKDVTIVTNKAYDLLSIASAAIVTSGTASLETALFNVPQIVCYKTSWVTYYVGKVLIKVPYLSLVNLIAEGQIVPELIQREYNRQTVSDHLKSIMEDGPARDQQLAGYRKVKTLLGNKKASQETARLIFDYLKSSKQPSTY